MHRVQKWPSSIRERNPQIQSKPNFSTEIKHLYFVSTHVCTCAWVSIPKCASMQMFPVPTLQMIDYDNYGWCRVLIWNKLHNILRQKEYKGDLLTFSFLFHGFLTSNLWYSFLTPYLTPLSSGITGIWHYTWHRTTFISHHFFKIYMNIYIWMYIYFVRL